MPSGAARWTGTPGTRQVAYDGQVGLVHDGGVAQDDDRLEAPRPAGDRHRDRDLDGA